MMMMMNFEWNISTDDVVRCHLWSMGKVYHSILQSSKILYFYSISNYLYFIL